MVALDGSLVSKQASPSSAVEGTNGRACRHAALSADVASRMLIALLLFLVGVVLIVSNPILRFIPGVLLIVVAIVVAVLAVLRKGLGAVAGIGATKTCPDCRSKIPSAAAVCRYCNYRYPQR
jgi:hypothetical protein